MMEIIKLSDRENNYKKYRVIEKLGYEIKKEVLKDENTKEEIISFTLEDKLNPNADQYIETRFRNINEILSAFADCLLSAGIIVTA